MHEAVDDVIARRRMEPDGLRRVMSTSMAIHFGTVALLLIVPKAWLIREQPRPLVMTISLGGSEGERSGGMSAAGQRPIEQVAPPPKRTEPIPPATPPKQSAIVVPIKAPPKAPPPPTPTPSTATAAVPRPATTGAQVRTGTAIAETGSTATQGTGLKSGGGPGDAQAVVDPDFCCKDYLDEVVRRISVGWARVQPDTGTTVIVFEILKDGTIANLSQEKSSGFVTLDVASKAAFDRVKFPPLPPQYQSDRLKVHLSFPYVR